MTDKKDRRYRLLRVDPKILEEMFGSGTGHAICDEQIPDLCIVASRFDVAMGWFEFICWSASFEVVPEHSMPPTWEPIAHRVDCRVLEGATA